MDRQTPIIVKSAERYVPQFKQKVLEFLKSEPRETNHCNDQNVKEKKTIAAAAKKFNVHPTTVSDWVQDVNRQKEISLLQQKHDDCSTNLKPCESTEMTITNKEYDSSCELHTVGKSQPCPLYDQIEKEFIDWLSLKRNDIDTGLFELTNTLIADKILDVFRKFEGNIFNDCATKVKLSWLILWFKKLKFEGNLCDIHSGEAESFAIQNTGVSLLDCDVKLNSRVQYAAPLKLEVVEYGKKLGQRKASRLFHISQKRIHEWTKESILVAAEYERQLENSANANETVPVEPQSLGEHSNSSITASRKRKASVSISGSRKVGSHGESQGDKRCTELSPKSKQQVLDLNVESEVCEWVQSSTSNPTSTEIRNKAIELYRSKGYDTIKCSYGWYRRWAERFKIWASTHDDTDPQVLTWLLEQYDDNNVVSYLSLQLYGHETLKRFKSAFKASPGWATRFVKRHHVFLNWDGFIEEKLPLNLQARIDVFLSKVRQMDLSGFQDDQIGCVDEIPLSFAGSSSKEKYSMDSDVKVSRLRKICLKNCDATAIISLRADGSILPPMVVVKGQKASSLNQVYSINDSPVIVFYSKTTEPTINALEKWLELVWLKNVKQPSVLFCDSYSLHRQLSTACKDAGIKQEIFPPGCSCKLQPINVYAKLTFRKLIENLLEEYLKKNSCEPKIKLPSTNEMVEWISHAYETMKQDLHKAKLMNSFKTAGLLAQGRAG